jgi:hypothetical protein
MPEEIFVTAQSFDDDVLIPLPEEFGFEEGDQFEIVKRPDGVIIMTSLKLNNDKK